MIFRCKMHHRLCILTCLGLAGCSTTPAPPSLAPLRGAAVHAVETERATRIAEAEMFAWGVIQVCGDEPLLPDAPFDDTGEAERLQHDVSDASYREMLAEIERLHPEAAENRDLAQQIWLRMLETVAKHGADAASARGCEAVRPIIAEALRALRSCQPAHPPMPRRSGRLTGASRAFALAEL